MKSAQKLELLLNAVDKNGKKLIYKPDDESRVYLDIDGNIRCLGRILFGEGNIYYHKMEDERNIFRKTQSWSINYSILPHIDLVHYESSSHDYLITRERALEFGEFFHFQDTTELKVYVPLIYWETRHKGLANVYPQEFKDRNAIGDSWYNRVKDVFTSPLVKGIKTFLKAERDRVVVYPKGERVFYAFKLCTFEHTKVVILGQDPYHDGTANGLAFGYLDGATRPYDKSLDIIYKEIERTVYNGFHLDHDFTLEPWAKQGVLLINCALTVEKGKRLSHSASENNPTGIGWERFTKSILYELMKDKTPKVFVLWGGVAKKQFKAVKDVFDKKLKEGGLFDTELHSEFPHLVLDAPHPAFDLRNKNQFGEVTPSYPTTFTGCDHFRKINEFLKQNKRKEIKW